jgi:hypothetical protein
MLTLEAVCAAVFVWLVARLQPGDDRSMRAVGATGAELPQSISTAVSTEAK